MRDRRLLVMVALLAAACGDSKPSATSQPALEPAKDSKVVPPAPAPEPTGVIEGTVVLADGAELPRRPDPKTSGKLAIVDPPAPCSPIGDADLWPVQLDKEGRGLASVHVALTGMKSTAPAAPRTHELAIEDCRLNRSLLAARMGDSVHIRNASGAPLLPTLPGDSFMEAILPGGERTVELKRAGQSQMSCGFAAYCGQTDVLVTTHSLFAVTDKTGHFRIEGVPLNVELTVNAWHPLFSVSKQPLKLTAAASAPLKLALSPSPAAVAPAPLPAETKQPALKPAKKPKDPADLLQ